MQEEKLMAKKFFLPSITAFFAVIYPLCYIFRVSDEVWKMSAIGSVPAGIWAITVPLSLFLTARALKKANAFFTINHFVSHEKPMDSNYYNSL